MGRTVAQWTDQVRNHLGDLGHLQRIDNHDIALALQAAMGELSTDQPREVTETFSGDGSTYDFDLSSTFLVGWSQVLEVEYPTGERTPSIVDRQAWTVLRGTSTLRMLVATPSVGQSLRATHSAQWPVPDDTASTDATPDPWFFGVAALAASHAARGKAAELARQQSKQVQGEFVRAAGGSVEQLYSLSDRLRAVYRSQVLGRPVSGEDPGAHLSISDTDISVGSLFHGGRR